MGNPSTIWSQLSLPLSAAGSVPYVDSDGITIVTKVSYFWFNPLSYQLSVGTQGDQSGTDSLNTYFNVDAYAPYNPLVSPLGANGTTAAHTVSTSRGSGVSPAINITGDFIGKFSAWAYTGSFPVYMELAGLTAYVAGTTNSVNGAAGELRFFAKPDNVATPVEYFKLSASGVLQPISSGSSVLGAAGFGWNGLFLTYTNTAVAGTAVTCNAPSGRVVLSATHNILTVTNSFVTTTSIVIPVVESGDATAQYVKTVTVGNGFFTLTMNANSTGTVGFSFLVINN